MATTSASTSASSSSAILTSMGIGSGIDINSIITQLMTVEKQPLQTLDAKISTDQTKISALGSVQSALSVFQAHVISLESASSYTSVKGSLANTAVGTVSTTGTAQQGSYSLSVSQLAQNQKLSSQSFTTVNDPVGTGTLSFSFGTFTDNSTAVPPSANTFVANGNQGAFSVTVDSSNNTLSGLRDAINAKNAGVTATIINDGSGYRLLMSSTNTGAANSLQVTAADDDGNNTDTNGLSRFAYDPLGTKNLTQSQVAQDAKLTLDGISISKASNTISDVLQGVSLNLQATTTTATTLSISSDTSGVAKSVGDLVTSYNSFIKAVNAVTFYDSTATDPTLKAGVLNGDQSVTSLQTSLRQTLNKALGGGNVYQSLNDVGISFDKTGNMTLDNTKLQNALSANPNAVASLFAVNGIASNSSVSYLGATDQTQTGQYDVQVTAPATQAGLSGDAMSASPITIDANNNSLMVAVDGVSSAMITLNAGSYTQSALAAEMQSQINGDSALKAAGVSVTMSYDSTNNKLVMHSNRYGSASNVQVTNVGANAETTYGLHVGLNASGTDVQGTIGGSPANGNGQVLTGTGNATDLKLSISGTTAGDYGTVSFSRGFASRLDQTITSLLSSSGPLTADIANLNSNITDIQSQEVMMNRQYDAMQATYTAQFTAMDSLVASLKSTGTFLTQQLASLTSSKA